VIADRDRVRLPRGVLVEGRRLVDPVREAPIPLNATGAIVAAYADGRTVASIAADLAIETGVGGPQALADTIAFCSELNRRLLLNVERPPLAFVRGAGHVSRGLRPVALRRRGGLGSLAAPAAAVAALAALSALPVAALAGVPFLPLLLGASVGAGLVFHEAGHAALLRGVPWCVAVAGARAEVLHRPLPPGRRAAVAVAGPVAAALVGGVGLAVAWWLAAPGLALSATTLVAHALGLTVLGGDGRAACGLS
jgi:hypothetical protein